MGHVFNVPVSFSVDGQSVGCFKHVENVIHCFVSGTLKTCPTSVPSDHQLLEPDPNPLPPPSPLPGPVHWISP